MAGRGNRDPKPKRRLARNSLTGAPLVPGLPTVATDDPGYASYDYRASHDDPTLVTTPLVLHQHAARSTAGVGLDYSPQFVRHLAASERDKRQADVVIGDRQWWLHPYGKRLVKQRLAEWFEPDVAALIFSAVVHYQTDSSAWRAMPGGLRSAIKDCDRLSRSHARGCDCPHCIRNNWTPNYTRGRI